jgi:hypothetical protein
MTLSGPQIERGKQVWSSPVLTGQSGGLRYHQGKYLAAIVLDLRIELISGTKNGINYRNPLVQTEE